MGRVLGDEKVLLSRRRLRVALLFYHAHFIDVRCGDSPLTHGVSATPLRIPCESRRRQRHFDITFTLTRISGGESRLHRARARTRQSFAVEGGKNDWNDQLTHVEISDG